MAFNIEVTGIQVDNFLSPIPKSENLLKWKVYIIQFLVKPLLNHHAAGDSLYLSHLMGIFVHFASEILMPLIIGCYPKLH